MSSANKIALEYVRQFGRSFVYIMKSWGPNTDPCGTPHGIVCVDDLVKLYSTNCVLLDR